MKTLASILLSFSLLAQNVTVSRSDSPRPAEADPPYFTGSVRVERVFWLLSRHGCRGRVTFEAGARTAWHTPLRQTLIVTEGAGSVRHWGGPVQESRPGDVVRIPPGTKHWNGTTATTRMSHIALQRRLNGKVVTSMEKVSDEQYKQR